MDIMHLFRLLFEYLCKIYIFRKKNNIKIKENEIIEK